MCVNRVADKALKSRSVTTGLPTTRQQRPWVLLFEKLNERFTYFFGSFLLYPMAGSFDKVCAEHPRTHRLLNSDDHVLTNPVARMASQGGSVDWFRFWLQGYEDPNPTKADRYKRWRELKTLQVENEKHNTPATAN